MRIAAIFGPVFAYESLLASRRWQVYAGRAVFVALLLACLSSIWRIDLNTKALTPNQNLVRAGERFHHLMVIVELVLVLLAAPAATAGAICLDKTRGTLTHLLTTDLTDAEIVLGKLAARLPPIVALLACALPVSAIAVLLGGVSPVALISLFLIAVGLTLVGCSLTMLLSVWGSKPHEVLTAVYLIWAAWLLPWALLEQLNRGSLTPILKPLRLLIPFWIALEPFFSFSPFNDPSLKYALFFLGVMVVISIVMAWLAVLSLRPAALRMANRKLRPVVESRAVRRFRRDVPWWPSPSLDANPVLWREWHRARPTRWTRVVWGLYLGATGVSGAVCIAANLSPDRLGLPSAYRLSSMVVAATAGLGFLLMSVTSATSLAEERVRGTLDVLMATPLSTASIVWGKWRGTFRLTPLVLFCPVLICYSQVLRIVPDARVAVFYVMLPYGIAWGAFVTSLGLALACWTKRLGRALAVAVVVNVVLAVGVPLIVGPADVAWLPASPFMGMGSLSFLMEGSWSPYPYDETLDGGVRWTIVYAIVAVGLYVATRLTFNRTLGRVSERPRRSRAAPRR